MILQKKREEQLEASRQRLFDSTVSRGESLLEPKVSENKSEPNVLQPAKKEVVNQLENSMIFCKSNKSWHDLSVSDDSFLALERQCNMDDKRERLMNANDTLLFDVEPPSELWNQTVNQSVAADTLDMVEEQDEAACESDQDTIEISPVKYVGLTRPSTIIEETSSQLESSSKTTIQSNNSTVNNLSVATKSSLYATASTNDSSKELSIRSCDVSNDSKSESTDSIITPLRPRNSQSKKMDRQRRGTFAFKRANYTFFPDENLGCIDESTQSFSDSVETKTPNKVLVELEKSPKSPSDEPDEDQFNNTLERVDYLLECGKQIVEETPVSKRNSHHQSLLETPLFSCKRKRLLSEMASIEMLPLPKRGPLIDFSTPEFSNQSRVSKFSGH